MKIDDLPESSENVFQIALKIQSDDRLYSIFDRITSDRQEEYINLINSFFNFVDSKNK